MIEALSHEATGKEATNDEGDKTTRTKERLSNEGEGLTTR